MWHFGLMTTCLNTFMDCFWLSKRQFWNELFSAYCRQSEGDKGWGFYQDGWGRAGGGKQWTMWQPLWGIQRLRFSCHPDVFTIFQFLLGKTQVQIGFFSPLHCTVFSLKQQILTAIDNFVLLFQRALFKRQNYSSSQRCSFIGTQYEKIILKKNKLERTEAFLNVLYTVYYTDSIIKKSI